MNDLVCNFLSQNFFLGGGVDVNTFCKYIFTENAFYKTAHLKIAKLKVTHFGRIYHFAILQLLDDS